MAGYCSICGSLKIQETCLLCRSLNTNSTLEDGSGSGAGRGDASVQDHSLHRFIGVPVLSPSFYTTLGQGELLKPSSSQNLPSSPQAPWMNPNASPLSPSPAKGASAQWPPLPVLRPAVSDLFLLSSLPTTGVIPTGHGDMPIGSPVIPQEILDHEVGELNFLNFVFIFTSSFSVQYTST